jgi:hypothetical protein
LARKANQELQALQVVMDLLGSMATKEKMDFLERQAPQALVVQMAHREQLELRESKAQSDLQAHQDQQVLQVLRDLPAHLVLERALLSRRLALETPTARSVELDLQHRMALSTTRVMVELPVVQSDLAVALMPSMSWRQPLELQTAIPMASK